MTVFTVVDSPLGALLLVAADDQLTGLYTPGHHRLPDPSWTRDPDQAVLVRTADQLADYFAGTRRVFDLPLGGRGTAFQESVWKGLLDIGYGQTESYGALARRIGSPAAMRAVGAANGRNPISIVVPCHRVVGGNGSLTGYAGGLDAKRWLLDHERRVLGPTPR